MLKRYLCFFCVTCIYSHSGDISARAPFKFCAVITIYSYSPNSSLLIRRLKLNCQVHVQFPRFNACVTAKQQLATTVCSLMFQAYVVIFGNQRQTNWWISAIAYVTHSTHQIVLGIRLGTTKFYAENVIYSSTGTFDDRLLSEFTINLSMKERQ